MAEHKVIEHLDNLVGAFARHAAELEAIGSRELAERVTMTSNAQLYTINADGDVSSDVH